MRQFLRFALAGMTLLSSSSFVWALSETATTAGDSYVTSVPLSRAETVQVKVNISLASPLRYVTNFIYYDMNDPSARYGASSPGSSMNIKAYNGRWMFLATVLDYAEMKPYIIVRENVAIDGNTTLELSDSEARNHISVNTILPNGEDLLLNSMDDTGKMLDDGNCRDCSQNIVLFRKDTNLVRALTVDALTGRYKSETDGDVEINGDFYISDLSENLALSVIRKCTAADYEVYSIAYEFGASINSDRELTNGDWFKLQSDYAELPDSKIKADGDYYQIASYNLFDDRDMDGLGECTTYTKGKPYSYISVPEPTMQGMDLHRHIIIHGKAVGTNGKNGPTREHYPFTAPPVTRINGKMTHLVYPFEYMGDMPSWYNKTDPGFFLGCTFPVSVGLRKRMRNRFMAEMYLLLSLP